MTCHCLTGLRAVRDRSWVWVRDNAKGFWCSWLGALLRALVTGCVSSGYRPLGARMGDERRGDVLRSGCGHAGFQVQHWLQGQADETLMGVQEVEDQHDDERDQQRKEGDGED